MILYIQSICLPEIDFMYFDDKVYFTYIWLMFMAHLVFVGKYTICRSYMILSDPTLYLVIVSNMSFVMFTPIWGEIPILSTIFQRGWFNHQLVS